MPNAFNFSASPFDCLAPDEQRLVRDSVDIAYFREGETLLEPGIEPAHLFVVIKGHVAQLDGDETVATFAADDCFDGRALVTGRASSRFVATEEVLAYQLAKAAVNALIAGNATFGALLFCRPVGQARRDRGAPQPARDAGADDGARRSGLPAAGARRRRRHRHRRGGAAAP